MPEFRCAAFSEENVTQFHKRDLPASEPGTPLHTLLKPKFSDDGNYILVPAGEVSVYDEIQSHAESCDINILMKRYLNGDATALSRAQGAYFDASSMPRTYAEMLNMVLDAENAFNSLPVDERAKFDHSFEKWLMTKDLFVDKPAEPSAGVEDSQSSSTVEQPPAADVQ